VGAVAMMIIFASGCAPRARMCTASTECADKNACVAGRCQPEKASVKPAIDSARRIVVRPVDVAWVRVGDAPSDGSLPPFFSLGRGGEKLLLRFSVVIPQTANIVEAYVVLRRATVVDDDPTPISLHATRIIESWEGRSTCWAMQPRSAETRSAPTTTVDPSGPSLVRLDVRELVRQWAKRDPLDNGIAIVSENESRTGTTFALTALGAERGSDEPSRSGRGGAFDRASVGSITAPDVEPYLELYLR
jgi:hypothetical protein